jgi:hypothetical protein
MSTAFPSQKTTAISFQADNVCVNVFGLFDECVCIHFFAALWFQHSQMKLKFHHLLLLGCDKNSSPSLWYRPKKVKAEGKNSLRFVRTREHFWNTSCAKLMLA